MAQALKKRPAMPKTWVRSLGGEDPLEEGMATHSSILDGKSRGQRRLVCYTGQLTLQTNEFLKKEKSYSVTRIVLVAILLFFPQILHNSYFKSISHQTFRWMENSEPEQATSLVRMLFSVNAVCTTGITR